jgi:hypothetical protein
VKEVEIETKEIKQTPNTETKDADVKSGVKAEPEPAKGSKPKESSPET